MSDPVLIALLASIPGTLGAVFAGIAAIISARSKAQNKRNQKVNIQAHLIASQRLTDIETTLATIKTNGNGKETLK